jgi:3-deoxy-D-manno-octulosonate 8-phosphate phosphatase (KDO 8-P phosphatase)
VIQDVADKLSAWTALRNDLGLAAEECAHIGDDLPDIPVLATCGLAVTVPHAPAAVRAHAHVVTARGGGEGAVRELAELLLAAQGRLEALIAPPLVGTRA